MSALERRRGPGERSESRCHEICGQRRQLLLTFASLFCLEAHLASVWWETWSIPCRSSLSLQVFLQVWERGVPEQFSPLFFPSYNGSWQFLLQLNQPAGEQWRSKVDETKFSVTSSVIAVFPKDLILNSAGTSLPLEPTSMTALSRGQWLATSD